MTTPIKISDEMVAAAYAAVVARWAAMTGVNPPVIRLHSIQADARAAVEAVAPLIAAQVLREAYWKLREHASGLRATEVYRKASERREGTLGESPAYGRYRWLEATARGIEDGARDLAELLGVEEYDIEKPENGRERSPCPTCSGPVRETVGMVCQTCGTDYAPDREQSEPSKGSNLDKTDGGRSLTEDAP